MTNLYPSYRSPQDLYDLGKESARTEDELKHVHFVIDDVLARQGLRLFRPARSNTGECYVVRLTDLAGEDAPDDITACYDLIRKKRYELKAVGVWQVIAWLFSKKDA